MPTLSYRKRRGQLETYFDRTAAEAWSRLTSDAPLGRIRATVRAGRERMRRTLLDWLPADLTGKRLLDAGCGTGALAVEAARRGADVVAVDLSPTLIELARERAPTSLGGGSLIFIVGDMMDESFGQFDYAVAMDSLIHYRPRDVVQTLAILSQRIDHALLATFAPRTPALTLMHAAGKIFPRGNRSPAIEPVSEGGLRRLIAADPALSSWRPDRTERVSSGFYISQALEMRRV